jgi:excinuclease UvrABC nuclease subunit
MVNSYQGHYTYTQKVIGDWNNSQIGVYYCGYIGQNGNLMPLYIGQAVGQGGIRGRLLQHLNQDSWPDVTHFGYCVCGTTKEASDLESAEILKHQPKYNTQGKNFSY